MKPFLLFTISLLATLTGADAEVIGSRWVTRIGEFPSAYCMKATDSATFAAKLSAPTKAPRKVTLTLKGNEQAQPVNLQMFSIDKLLGAENFPNKEETVSFDASLPTDAEFMVALFASPSASDYYYVCHDNLSSYTDDEIVFDVAEATHRVDFKLTMPDGSDPDFQIWNGQEMVKDGNIFALDITSGIYNRHFKDLCLSSLWGIVKGAYDRDGKPTDPTETFNFRVNDLSDDFYFGQIVNGACGDFTLVAVMKGNADETITVSAADYRHLPAAVRDNPAYDEYPNYPASFIYEVTDGRSIGWRGFPNVMFSPDYYVASTGIHDSQALWCGMRYNPLGEEGILDRENDYFPMVNTSDGDAREFVMLNYADLELPFGGNFAAIAPGLWGEESWLRPNLWPECSLSDEIVFGNDCPIFVPALRLNQDTKNRRFGAVAATYTGRNGDYRGADLHFARMSLHDSEGNILAEGVQEIEDWGNENGRQLYSGTYTLKSRIDNIRIDDVDGFNEAEFTFGGSTTFPAMQMLRFRDADGRFTDRLTSPQGSETILAGGCFAFHRDATNASLYYFALTDEIPDWRVEYAPMGSSDFQMLEIREIPDRDPQKAFGRLYSVSLDGVDRKSPNGWFDMRIRLNDTSGNNVSQVISPAFYIESLAGISIPEIDSNSPGIRYYNLQGYEMTNPRPGELVIRRQGNIIDKIQY